MRFVKLVTSVFESAPVLISVLVGQVSISGTAFAESSLGRCDVVVREDVRAAFGISVGEGRPRVEDGKVSVCMFAAPGGGTISVLMRRNTRPEWIQQQSGRMSRSAATYRPVEKLGDQAFALHLRGTGTALCIFYRNYYIQVSAFGLPSDRALARTILSRLTIHGFAGAGSAALGRTRIAQVSPPDR